MGALPCPKCLPGGTPPRLVGGKSHAVSVSEPLGSAQMDTMEKHRLDKAPGLCLVASYLCMCLGRLGEGRSACRGRAAAPGAAAAEPRGRTGSITSNPTRKSPVRCGRLPPHSHTAPFSSGDLRGGLSRSVSSRSAPAPLPCPPRFAGKQLNHSAKLSPQSRLLARPFFLSFVKNLGVLLNPMIFFSRRKKESEERKEKKKSCLFSLHLSYFRASFFPFCSLTTALLL